eukprot:m51a1_g7700 hypothetical protein (516) ;mRNA; r:72557-74870
MSRSPSRVENSPYPAGTVPTDVWVLDWGSLASPAERVMANTLAGCLAQAGSPDLLFLSMGSAGSDVWYGLLRQEPGLRVHTELAGDLRGLLAKFAGLLAGYVMGDEPPDCEPTRNAVCIAGTLRALVASPSTFSIASDAGLKQLADARGMSPEDTHRSTRRHTSTRVLVHQRNCEFLSDYAVFAKAFLFYDPCLETELAASAMGRLSAASAVLGWADDEYQQVLHASQLSKYVHAADFALNLALYTNMDNSNARGPRLPDTVIAPTRQHTVAFVMSDGDNIQWLLTEFHVGQRHATPWFGSPRRGSVPIGWTISPALVELAPMVMRHYIQQCTSADELVAAPSGVGYTFPDVIEQAQHGDLRTYAALSNRYLAMAGMTTATVIGKTYSQATCDTLLANSSAEGLVWLDYDNYAGMKDLHWSSTGKPIVGPRWILGHANNTQAGMGPDTKSASELASLLNAGSTDPRVASSYSVVVVHAWSANVDTVVSVASQLGGSVRVVKPTELLRLMTRNIPH